MDKGTMTFGGVAASFVVALVVVVVDKLFVGIVVVGVGVESVGSSGHHVGRAVHNQ